MRRNTRPRYPGGVRAAWGAAAALAGLVALRLAAREAMPALLGSVVIERIGGDTDTLAKLLGPAPIPPLRGSALVWANAHLVPIRVAHPDGGVVTANLLLAGDSGFAWLVAVPPVLLAAGGFAATVTADGPVTLRYDLFVGRAWTRYAFNGGVTVMFGYLPLALVVIPLAEVAGSQTSLSVDLLHGWIQAGLVYPVLFGGVGGVMAARYRRRSDG